MLRSLLQWIIWIALPVLAGGGRSHAQTSVFKPRFDVFTLPGDEGANQVQCILQDKTGFLWFGTRAGLIRYDGAQFVTYQHNTLDSNSIGSNYINWIFQDSRGILWLAHVNDGLTAFDPLTEKSVRYRHRENDPNSLANNYVSRILEYPKGSIWVGTGGGLDRLAPPAGKQRMRSIKHFRVNPTHAEDFISALYLDKQNKLWVGCGSPYFTNWPGGLYQLNPDGSFSKNLLPVKGADNRVQVMLEDRRGQFWLGACGPESVYRREGAGAESGFVRRNSPTLRRNKHVFPQYEHMTFMFEDMQGRLWMGAVEGGLDVFDPAAGTTAHFEKDAGKPGQLQSISLWHGCQAADGSIWLAGGDNGPVHRVTQVQPLFPFYDVRRLLGVGSCAVTGIEEAGPGSVWLQTLGDFTGIVHFDRLSGRVQKFPYRPPVQRHSLFDLFELKADPQAGLRAGTEYGLYRLDASAAAMLPDPFFAQQLPACPAFPPFRDKQGSTWVPAFGRGLYRFGVGGAGPVLYAHNPDDPHSIGGNFVKTVFEDRQGRLWVGGSSDGFNRRSPMFLDRLKTGLRDTFVHLLPAGELGDLDAIVEDRQGNFWFSAYPYAIRKLNPETGEYRAFTVANSLLTHAALTDMLPGPDGMIWMFASNAIIRFDPETESFFTFSSYHGIVDSATVCSWHTGSYAGANGELFFGTDGGFYAFDPRVVQAQLRRFPAQSKITDLKILGKRVAAGSDVLPNGPVWETEVVHLRHDQNVFAFQLASFDFGGPERSRLEYMLENYDDDWRADLRAGEASYIKVPPGRYTFRVRGVNSLGEPVRESSVRVVVRPPWWQSWWARAVFALLIGAALFAVYRLQLSRKLEHAEQRRLRELDMFKTRFYTNITHEFRTPLTLLIGPVERLLQENQVDGNTRAVLQTVRRNAAHLLNLINQLLDLAKLDSGKLALHPVQGDMVSYVNYLVESFHSAAEYKNIRLHFLTGLESLVMDFDEERMRQIGSNLLSNALKFMPEGGDVYIHLELQPATGTTAAPTAKPTLVFRVRDTGIGIPDDQLPLIFDRFYQADNALTRPAGGAGLGLSLARELARLMGGDIAVRSRPGWGTEFTVTLPVTRLASGVPGARMPATTEPVDGDSGSPPVLQPQQAAATAPLILLVEDNADVVHYLASCLPEYRLAIARDGQEGLELAMEKIPDILVSDVMMPRMDGLQLCHALKNDVRTSHIPVILLTAKADHASKMEGLEQGADAYLAKPFHQHELLLRIRKLLENRKALQTHYLHAVGLHPGNTGPMPPTPTAGPEQAFVQKAREIAESHLDDTRFDVEQFCREMAMSHSQLHRKLSALTGY